MRSVSGFTIHCGCATINRHHHALHRSSDDVAGFCCFVAFTPTLEHFTEIKIMTHAVLVEAGSGCGGAHGHDTRTGLIFHTLIKASASRNKSQLLLIPCRFIEQVR